LEGVLLMTLRLYSNETQNAPPKLDDSAAKNAKK